MNRYFHNNTIPFILSVLSLFLLGRQNNLIGQSDRPGHPHVALQAYLVLNFDDEQALELYNETTLAINARWRCFTKKTGIVLDRHNKSTEPGRKAKELEESGDKEFLAHSQKVEDLFQQEKYYIEECWEGEIPSAKELRNILSLIHISEPTRPY